MVNSINNILASVPRTESGAIDLTQAKRMVEGGTHVLYRFPESPFIIKVMKENSTVQELETLEKKYAVLYACFDKNEKQRCIREQHLLSEVKLPGEEPRVAALSIVPYEECFKAEVKFDFKIEPTELDHYLMVHQYGLLTKVNKALMQPNSAKLEFSLNDYGLLDERIGAILQRLDTDVQLKIVMTEFLEHYRDFYQKTNIILDAMGAENILFYQDEQGDWQFKIGSAIKHDTGEYTQELFKKVHEGEPLDLTKLVNYTHAYFSPANIRAVNACALKLGLNPVIVDVLIEPTDLLRVSQELPIGERMLAYAKHGDFKTMEKLFEQHKHQLTFNISDFWAYSRIADAYINHEQPLEHFKKYLDTVSELPIILPDNTETAIRMLDAMADIHVHVVECNKKLTLKCKELLQKEKADDVSASVTLCNSYS